jgi:P-type E1-E2 ATPase
MISIRRLIALVKPGEKNPVDGKITDGQSTIDESMISGEPIPVDKSRMTPFVAGTINGNQSFVMVAENRFRNLAIPNCANGQ